MIEKISIFLLIFIEIKFNILRAQNVKNATYVEDLFMPNGYYCKSIVYFNNYSLNQIEAENFCEQRKMRLFVIETSDVYEVYKVNINKRFKLYAPWFFFNAFVINKTVTTFSRPRVRVFEDYTWATDDKTGCVAMIRDKPKSFKTCAVHCTNQRNPFHCEYIDRELGSRKLATIPYYSKGTTVEDGNIDETEEEVKTTKTTKLTTPATTSTTPTPPSICNYTQNLYFPNGTFIKSICYINIYNANPFTAIRMCEENRMAFLTIDSSEMFEAYKSSLLKHFGSGNVQRFALNAYLLDSDLSMLTSPQTKLPDVFSWLTYLNNGCVYLRKLINNSFTAQAGGCNIPKAPFHCELKFKVVDSVPHTVKPVTTTPLTTTKKEGSTTKSSELPCGTFIHYDYLNDPEGPAKRGFLVGNSSSIKYFIGIGDDKACSGHFNVPSHIFIPPENPVAMIICDLVAIDGDNPQYLLNHSKLAWVSSRTISSSSKLVTTIDSVNRVTWNFGRISLKTKSGQFWKVGIYENGKLYYNTGSITDMSTVQLAVAADGFHVLVCRE